MILRNGGIRMRLLSRVCAALGAMTVLFCGQTARAANDADARLRAIYTTEWKWRDEQIADNEDAQKPIRDHLPKVDPASQAMRLRMWQDVLEKLNSIPRAHLSPAEQLNYDVYRPQIEALIASQRYRDFEMPANADTTFWTDLGYTARRLYRTPQDYRNWISQMIDIPRYFSEQADEMRHGLQRGFTPSRITLQGRDASITAVTEAEPDASLFYAPFKDMPGVSEAEQVNLRTQAISAIRESVQPAYRELLKFMRTEYLPGTRTTLAAYDLPDGRNYYRAKIREFTTLDQDPAAIHAFGESEVERLHKQMLAVMKETGFAGDFASFLVFLRTDPQFQAKTPQELLMRAAWIAKRFDAKASQYFGLLPRARFAIRPVRMISRRFTRLAAAAPGCTWSTPMTFRVVPCTTSPHSRCTSPRPVMRFRCLSRSNTNSSRNFGNTPISPPTARAGRCTASSWAWKWGCTKLPMTASAC
jgi:uncharacterized protein (DUF885 family)